MSTATVAPAPKSRPILFSIPMVTALRTQRKTQTRRVLKVHPHYVDHVGGEGKRNDRFVYWNDKKEIWWREGDPVPAEALDLCPYGKVGDRLWVKERMFYTGDLDDFESVSWCAAEACQDPELTARMRKPLNPIFMPRYMSRFTLEITERRIERVQSITTADAIAEGVDATGNRSAVENFSIRWDTINGDKHPWRTNPWVWCIGFKLVQKAQH